MSEQLKNLLDRARGLIIPLLIGFFLIIYGSFGIVYFKQSQEQDNLQDQITQQESTVSQSMELSDKLKADYDEAQQATTAEWSNLEVMEIILNIARERGFDIGPETKDIQIEVYKRETETLGEVSYNVLPLQVSIKGDEYNVMSFIDDISSTPEIKTIVVENLKIQLAAAETTATLECGIYTKGT